MIQLYNGVDSLTFPNGETFSPAQLREHAAYSKMFDSPHVIFLDGGVTRSIVPLDDVKADYGVTETDPQKALAAVEAEMQRRDAAAKKEAELYASAMDTTQQATAELGVMTATAMESTADLGVTVAALETRIAALEAANAPKA